MSSQRISCSMMTDMSSSPTSGCQKYSQIYKTAGSFGVTNQFISLNPLFVSLLYQTYTHANPVSAINLFSMCAWRCDILSGILSGIHITCITIHITYIYTYLYILACTGTHQALTITWYVAGNNNNIMITILLLQCYDYDITLLVELFKHFLCTDH
jgi:hypothetical protein